MRTVVEAASRFAREVLRPAAQTLDAADQPATHSWRDNALWCETMQKSFALGFHVAALPERVGGAGLDRASFLQVIEALAWGDAGFASTLAAQASVGTLLRADPTLLEEIVLPCAKDTSGTWLVASGMSEPNGGSLLYDMRDGDPARFSTRARRTDNGFVLSGRKQFVTHAGIEKIFFVVAGLDDDPGFAVFCIPAKTKGVSYGKPERKMGQRCSPQADVVLDDVELPSRYLLPTTPSFADFQAATLSGGSLIVAACSLGIAQAALDDMGQRGQTHKVGTRLLGELGSVRADVGKAFIEVAAARALVYAAAKAPPEDVAIRLAAKVKATETAIDVTRTMLSLSGAHGCMEGLRFAKLHRDALVGPASHGTNGLAIDMLGSAAFD